MLKLKKGYTLAEVMVVMALLGILASILLPAVSNVRPNRDKMMFKKAYHVAERIVYELVNDDDLYPSKEGLYSGLDNTEDANFNGTTYSGNTKFCSLFAHKVNTIGDIQTCSTTAITPAGSGTYTNPTFTTTDGIAWYLPISNFKNVGVVSSNVARIMVDINNSKKPNCSYHATNCPKPDIFTIYVQKDGKMYVSGTIEKEFLKSNTTTR